MTITAINYWKNLKTGSVYKYYNGSKPYLWETDWVMVSAHDYDAQGKA